ncbi:MAG: hypothetical protein KHW46_08105 [Clostridiales bacterium]|nr:hypothetical protein [Clostridiales bacterium]
MDEQRNHENNAHPENYEYTQQPFYGQAEPPVQPAAQQPPVNGQAVPEQPPTPPKDGQPANPPQPGPGQPPPIPPQGGPQAQGYYDSATASYTQPGPYPPNPGYRPPQPGPGYQTGPGYQAGPTQPGPGYQPNPGYQPPGYQPNPGYHYTPHPGYQQPGAYANPAAAPKKSGMALAGIITGAIGTALSIFILVVLIGEFATGYYSNWWDFTDSI